MPIKTTTSSNTLPPDEWGVVYLSEEEFAELERQQTIPVEPTEAIKRGAALLRRLYGRK